MMFNISNIFSEVWAPSSTVTDVETTGKCLTAWKEIMCQDPKYAYNMIYVINTEWKPLMKILIISYFSIKNSYAFQSYL